VSPFGAGRTAPPISDMKNDGWTTVWFSTPGGGTGVKSIYLGPGGTFGYYGSSAGLHSTALQSGKGGSGRK
ncbi:MAG: hypothetical protein WBW11_21070, partial [Pseudolabrys sp.]